MNPFSSAVPHMSQASIVHLRLRYLCVWFPVLSLHIPFFGPPSVSPAFHQCPFYDHCVQKGKEEKKIVISPPKEKFAEKFKQEELKAKKKQDLKKKEIQKMKINPGQFGQRGQRIQMSSPRPSTL